MSPFPVCRSPRERVNPEETRGCFVFTVGDAVNWEWERRNREEAIERRGKSFTIHLLAHEQWGQASLALTPVTPCHRTSHC